MSARKRKQIFLIFNEFVRIHIRYIGNGKIIVDSKCYLRRMDLRLILLEKSALSIIHGLGD